MAKTPVIKTIKWDGKQITKPGIYSAIPLELYHAANICDGPSVSSSMLRKLNPDIGSPKHFYDTWQGNPNRKPEKDASHFVLGRAVHHLMLGEPFFASLFVKQPDEYEAEEKGRKTGELRPWTNNAGVCQRWNAEQAKNGRAIITNAQIEQIKKMSVAISAHPLVKEGILAGYIERSMFWKDKETGLWMKARPDSIPSDSADFADLKTTQSTLYADLMRTLRKFAYYQQAALIRAGCRELIGMDMQSFTFIFAESQSPWDVRDMRLFDEDMKRGDRMNRAMLRVFADCYEKKHWPGPGEGNEGNERLQLSGAAREAIDSRLKLEGLADGED